MLFIVLGTSWNNHLSIPNHWHHQQPSDKHNVLWHIIQVLSLSGKFHSCTNPMHPSPSEGIDRRPIRVIVIKTMVKVEWNLRSFLFLNVMMCNAHKVCFIGFKITYALEPCSQNAVTNKQSNVVSETINSLSLRVNYYFNDLVI